MPRSDTRVAKSGVEIGMGRFYGFLTRLISCKRMLIIPLSAIAIIVLVGFNLMRGPAHRAQRLKNAEEQPPPLSIPGDRLETGDVWADSRFRWELPVRNDSS